MASTIWQQCYDHNWCVHVPLDGQKCFGIHACISVIEDGARLILQLQLNGVTKQIDLADLCVDLPVSIFDLKVCIANLNVSAPAISFDISVQGCIDINLGFTTINECVPLTTQHVVIGKMSGVEAERFIAPEKLVQEQLFVFYTRDASPEEREKLATASKSGQWRSLLEPLLEPRGGEVGGGSPGTEPKN